VSRELRRRGKTKVSLSPSVLVVCIEAWACEHRWMMRHIGRPPRLARPDPRAATSVHLHGRAPNHAPDAVTIQVIVVARRFGAGPGGLGGGITGQGERRRRARLKVPGRHITQRPRGVKSSLARPAGAQEGLHIWPVFGMKLSCYNRTQDGFGKSAREMRFFMCLVLLA
jgi:hypothetical protein